MDRASTLMVVDWLVYEDPPPPVDPRKGIFMLKQKAAYEKCPCSDCQFRSICPQPCDEFKTYVN